MVLARIGPDRLPVVQRDLSPILVALRDIHATLRSMSGQPVEAARGAVAPAVSIDEAVERWRDDLTARDCTPRSIDRMVSIVERLAECSGWMTAPDVTYQSAVAFLAARRRQEPPWSNATHDQAVSTLRTFGEFLRRSGVLPTNPLQDLQSVGALNPQGARALTVEDARSLIECSIERHLQSRRAKGCAPLYWTVLFLTGLRVSEAASMRWEDMTLDDEHPCIWTDPRWEGNKAGRRDRIPLHPELVGLLRKFRASRMYRAGVVFPMVPTVATWNMDRDAAGIAARDTRKRKATRHSTRKSFCTWLDALSIPRGIVSKLARHATTLTERVYVDHGDAVERKAICQLRGIWPKEVDIFSVRAQISVDKPGNVSDAVCVQAFNPMESTSTTSRPSTPGRNASIGTPEQRASAAFRPGVGDRGTESADSIPTKATNGQVAPISSPTLEDEVVSVLARWLSRRAGSVDSSEEPAHADEVHDRSVRDHRPSRRDCA